MKIIKVINATRITLRELIHQGMMTTKSYSGNYSKQLPISPYQDMD